MIQNSDSISKYFTEQAKVWKNVYESGNSLDTLYYRENMQKRREIVLDALDNYFEERSGRVLDAGCGAGSFIIALADRGHECIGMDITDEMLKLACEAINCSDGSRRARLIKGSVENIPTEDETFDVALCVGVLEYVRDLDAALSELVRVIRPNGILLLTFPNFLKLGHILDPYYALVRFPKFLCSRRTTRWGALAEGGNADIGRNDQFCCRRFTTVVLDRMFRRFGLHVVARENVCFGPLTFWRHDLLGPARVVKLSASLCRLAEQRAFRWLGQFADRWVFVLKRSQ